jgi:hypothetical protein
MAFRDAGLVAKAKAKAKATAKANTGVSPLRPQRARTPVEMTWLWWGESNCKGKSKTQIPFGDDKPEEQRQG